MSNSGTNTGSVGKGITFTYFLCASLTRIVFVCKCVSLLLTIALSLQSKSHQLHKNLLCTYNAKVKISKQDAMQPTFQSGSNNLSVTITSSCVPRNTPFTIFISFGIHCSHDQRFLSYIPQPTADRVWFDAAAKGLQMITLSNVGLFYSPRIPNYSLIGSYWSLRRDTCSKHRQYTLPYFRRPLTSRKVMENQRAVGLVELLYLK